MTTSSVGINANPLVSRQSGIKRPRRGVAAVEFAVIAPLFLLLLAGIIEFGQAFRIQHMISTASRQGARIAIVDGSTSEKVRKTVRQFCVKTLGVAEGIVTVDVLVNGNKDVKLVDAVTRDEIEVAVSIPFAQAGVGFYAAMFSDVDLTANCIFERE